MNKPRWRDLADRLAWARTVAGISAYALSRKALKSKTHVGLIEHRIRKNIEMETAQKLAAVLGVSWSWLMSGEGVPPTEEQIRSASKAA